ncbi:uncharacterized protein PADG_00271 [Paracoccidioides brasiliensis Pb18]|uniref:Asteroid domain-containing protein n=1 Tax=Paracoccidioides brasiliensis (strain Pb18) TaxID=502780 RepID=C1G081_PARBD|nr:uncharacterized protein PADG_00271 [Paracoccidioides brasiliensis Pb18]EEH43982.2 hypothetical protein PADG_00271 [Paracoccidioides brasiliensis Pb18]
MGILFLTRHLLPHAQTVWLRNNNKDDQSTKNITSIVIDGPGLVYDVYEWILPWSDESANPVDAQPSADEVSIAVMHFLLCLTGVGVRIENIYFDGALPLSKRNTRLERMEATRQKLEKLCCDTRGGFKVSSIRSKPMSIPRDWIFGRRPPSSRFKFLPAPAFMIPTVIEDLKYRWSREEVMKCTARVPELHEIASRQTRNIDNIFAGLVEVVLGEADEYCAATAKNYGCAVLTGDSDLLVHDLGAEGSVIFFNSIEMGDILHIRESSATEETEDPDAMKLSIRAMQLHPATIAKKLGVVSFQRLAYELKKDPYTSFATLIHRAKSTTGVVEKSASYQSFMKEYSNNISGNDSKQIHVHMHTDLTDPKLSELFTQYELPAFNGPETGAYVYLPILVECHGRRAAWLQGSELRLLAYSLLNLRYAADEGRRKGSVVEYMRKGQRIAPVTLTLMTQREVERRLGAFLGQVNGFMTAVYGCYGDSVERSSVWKCFALYDILSRMEGEDRPRVGEIRRFLERGYCGAKLEWDDIHLHAQMQAVLYSLRLLKELLVVDGEETWVPLFGEMFGELVREVSGLLADLPWMHVATQRRGEFGGDVDTNQKVVEGLFLLLNVEEWGEELDGESVQGLEVLRVSPNGQGDLSMAKEQKAWRVAVTKAPSKKGKRTTSNAGLEETAKKLTRKGSNPKPTTNMYDILRQVGD